MDISKLQWNWAEFVDAELNEIPAGVEAVYCIAAIVDDKIRATYFGEAKDVQTRLMEHYYGQSREAACINKEGSTHFTYWSVQGGKAARVAVETALLDRFPTPCND